MCCLSGKYWFKAHCVKRRLPNEKTIVVQHQKTQTAPISNVVKGWYMSRRFASSNGNAPSFFNRFNAIRSIFQSFERKIFHKYPELPWIPFSAHKALSEILTQESIVWEVGAGNSTIWLSRRVRHITAVEADEKWFNKLNSIINDKQIKNVDLRYIYHGHEMSSYDRDDIDLLYIDGGPRSQCLLNGVSHVKSGGYVYLDNTDVIEFWHKKDPFAVDEKLQERVAWKKTFVDYVPASFGVYEGILAKLK